MQEKILYKMKNILLKQWYNIEDIKAIKQAQKYCIITDEEWKKQKKTELKKADPTVYYSWLARSTFHMTAARTINGKEYYFKNKFYFSN